MPGLGGGAPLRHRLRPNTVLAYEPRDAMLANLVSLFEECPPDPGTAVGVSRFLAEYSNGGEQRPRLNGPGTLSP
jgi:hypothetical protein